MAKSQSKVRIDSLVDRIRLYGVKQEGATLFVHFDKTVYANNENVWFTGYLLNAGDLSVYNTLSVALINNLDRTVVFESRYVINNGIAFGKAVIPDSAPPGNYTVIAITNLLKNRQPQVVFKYPVTIRSANEPEFLASLNAVDTAANLPQQKVRLNISFKNLPSATKKGPQIPEVQITYFVGDASMPTIKGYGKSKEGIYDFSIPSAALTEGNNKLTAQLWYKDKVSELSINLPARKLPPVITFYPEGGNLVNNISSRIGWQAKTTAGAPLGLTGFLYKNGVVVDTVTTDSKGAGIFELMPVPGARYTMSIYGYTAEYVLPTQLDKGVVLLLKNALVNDTLLVTIKSLQNQKVYLIGHNYNEVFFNMPITLVPGYKRLAFVLGDVPVGISELILVDSAGRSLAQRLFFSHYNKQTVLTVTMDKSQYGTRRGVKVKLRLNAVDGERASVSIAGVQAKRVKANGVNNIASYFYWKNDMPDAALPDDYSHQTKSGNEQLEAQLLVNAWTKYKWADVIKVTAADASVQYTDLVFTGRVTYMAKPLTKPVALFNTGNPSRVVNTDNYGKFELSGDDLKTDSAAELSFMASGKEARNYSIYLNDAYSTTNQQLATDLQLQSSENIQASSQYLYLPDNEHAIKLKEVNIKAKTDNQFYGALGNPALQAQNASSFNGSIRNGDGTVTNYTQINIQRAQKQQYLLRVNGVQQKAESFKTDPLSTTEPQYLSTLFWKHQTELLPDQETELTFNTSDITGDFKIIVQGKTASGVVYGETSFNVNK